MRKMNLLNINKSAYIVYSANCSYEVIKEEESGKIVVQVPMNKDTKVLSEAYNEGRKGGIALDVEDIIEFLAIQEDIRNKVADARRRSR